MEKKNVNDCNGNAAKFEGVKSSKTIELVFILDRSGSMAGMEKDTIGGFNAMIEKQKAINGRVYVSTVTFSNYSTVLHDRDKIGNILPLTEKDYQVGGGTALLDAVGDAIHHIGNIHRYIRKEDVPEKTLFVITTDGMENASRRYTYKDIKEKIRRQEEEYGWEFLFVADNIDVAQTAESMGIRRECATSYRVKEDTSLFYEEMSQAIASCRETGQVPVGWADKIRKNTKENKSKNI